jgi:hypothetical protein
VEEQLNNTNFYERKTHNKTQENTKLLKTPSSTEDAKILVIDNPRTSTFYLLPKIH